MDLGVKGLGKTQSTASTAGKPASAPADALGKGETAAIASGDALALGGKLEFPPTSSRQVARDFAEKFTRLQAAEHDPEAYDRTADAIGTQSYVLIDAVNRLCRDTQAEPYEDRLKALNMIQHLAPLPDEMRQAIEADLRRTSPAA